MSGIDRNDRDSADYLVSIRTNRYYLRICAWALDRVIHCLYQIVCYCVMCLIGDPTWKAYLANHEGRRNFQIAFGIGLMNYGLALEWDGSTNNRPDYVRQDAFTPCDYEICFFLH